MATIEIWEIISNLQQSVHSELFYKKFFIGSCICFKIYDFVLQNIGRGEFYTYDQYLKIYTRQYSLQNYIKHRVYCYLC
jgi:hypothetical protein